MQANGEPSPIITTNPIVEIIEKVLAQARAGQVTSIAIVAVSPQGGVFNPAMGPQMADLHTGLAMIQADIIAAIRAARDPKKIVAAPPGLMIPR